MCGISLWIGVDNAGFRVKSPMCFTRNFGHLFTQTLLSYANFEEEVKLNIVQN